jgi:uncharacterized membrane protein required for colicin V production
MTTVDSIAAIVFGAFMAWRLYVYIRSRPESLSKESLNKSSNTMLWLFLALAAFIGAVVMIL